MRNIRYLYYLFIYLHITIISYGSISYILHFSYNFFSVSRVYIYRVKIYSVMISLRDLYKKRHARRIPEVQQIDTKYNII